MKLFENMEFWFVTGSQHMYGPAVLGKVAAHTQIIVQALEETAPAKVVCKGVVTTLDEILACIMSTVPESLPGCIRSLHLKCGSTDLRY